MKKRILKVFIWTIGSVVALMLFISATLYFFKDEICGYVLSEVNKQLKSEIEVQALDLTFWGSFPSLSVDLNHVFIRDACQGATDKDTLLFSERVRFKFNPLDIWNERYNVKAIEVNPGTLKLKVAANGAVNYNLIKETKEESSTAFQLKLERVDLTGIRFFYRNAATRQYYQSELQEMQLEGNFSDEQYDLHTDATMLIKSIRSGEITLLREKLAVVDFKLNVNQLKHTVEIPSSKIQLAGLPFEIEGRIEPEQLHFGVKSQDIKLAEFVNKFSIQSTDELKSFKGDGQVYFNLALSGENDANSPVKIDCAFGVENGTLTEPVKQITLYDIRLEGHYTNNGEQAQETLELADVHFNTAGGPFSGNLKIKNFSRPRYQGKAKGSVDLHMLHALFNLPYVETVNGRVAVNTAIDVSAKESQNGQSDYSINRLEGDVQLQRVNLKLEDDKRLFADMQGLLYFTKNEAGIEDAHVKIGSSDLSMNGTFGNIVGYFFREESLQTDVTIESRYLDVQDLGTTSKEEKIKDGRDFVLPDRIKGDVQMNVEELKYDKHQFKELKGKMQIENRLLNFPSIRLMNADAYVMANLEIEERSPEIFTIHTNASSDDIKIKALFKEWDNFHQKVIGQDNIDGKVQAKIDFTAPFDLRSGIVEKSIQSKIFMRIMDGRLKNVDAFRSITESLNGSSVRLLIGKENVRAFEKKLLDLKFETMENTFLIQNGEVNIPSMLIKSSALDVEASGKHRFDNTIDYRFIFRYRDLKEKVVSEFGEEVDDGTGIKIFMHMYGSMEKPIIEWDKTSRKEQAKENREKEKENVKSMLKSEFGLFKYDTAVKTYQPKQTQKEVIKVEVGPAKEEDPLEVQKKKKKDSKLKNALNNWKKESDKSKEEDLEFN